jgi:hypothetical protein
VEMEVEGGGGAGVETAAGERLVNRVHTPVSM